MFLACSLTQMYSKLTCSVRVRVCVCWVVRRFGCRPAGCHPSALQAPLPQTPDAGKELQHQGQVRTTQGNRQCRWRRRRRWWWMFFLLSPPPQGAGWNSAETGSFGARGRLCELNYVTYCDTNTHTHLQTNPLWCCAQMFAYTCLTDLQPHARALRALVAI